MAFEPQFRNDRPLSRVSEGPFETTISSENAKDFAKSDRTISSANESSHIRHAFGHTRVDCELDVSCNPETHGKNMLVECHLISSSSLTRIVFSMKRKSPDFESGTALDERPGKLRRYLHVNGFSAAQPIGLARKNDLQQCVQLNS